MGHVQRGGTPSSLEILIASAFGIAAVDLIAEEKFDRMVAWQQREVMSLPLEDAIAKYRGVEPHSTLVKMARGLGRSLGD